MNKKIKNQKGIVSVFAMMAMLFFLLFILGAYMAVSRNNRTQKESNKEVLELYSSDVNPQDVYNDIIADSTEVIPLYTYDQVNDIGGNNFFAIDGKIYCFESSNNGLSSASYELKTNLSLLENNYESKNFNYIDKGNNKYVDSDSLKLSLDGINNNGDGHSNNVNQWTNLINNGASFTRFDIYDGGEHKYSPVLDSNGKVISSKWIEDGLSFDGSGDHVRCNGILNAKINSFTYEIVFKTNSLSSKQRLIGNWNNGGSGLTYYSNGELYGEVSLPNNVKRKVSTNGCGIKGNDITYAAITFDGEKISLYKNGIKVSDDSENKMDKASTETIEYQTLPSKLHYGDDFKSKMGIHSYIGKTNEDSADGITITPYFSKDDGFVIPSFRRDQGGKVNPTFFTLDDNTKEYGTNFYRNISGLNKEYKLKFNAGLQVTRMHGLDNFDLEINDVKIGNLNIEKSFSVIANGSDSVIIRSNIGKIQTWYFNDRQKLVSSNNGEVEILGTYYYCFDGLDPNTTYNIRGEFSTDTIYPNIVGDDLPTIYIGNSYDNKFEGESGVSLNGVVYAVRVYDKALSSDNIKTNYLIDKKRFSIKD